MTNFMTFEFIPTHYARFVKRVALLSWDMMEYHVDFHDLTQGMIVPVMLTEHDIYLAFEDKVYLVMGSARDNTPREIRMVLRVKLSAKPIMELK